MSVQLSVSAQSFIKETGIQPQIILDIEGVDLIFGALPVLKMLQWDEEGALWDDGLAWDGKIGNAKSRDYISLNDTTTNITQQIAPDKEATSSISTVNIALIDKDGEVSKALSFDAITEILGRKAIFSIGFAQGAYPEDCNPVFRGVVVDFYTEPGKIMVSLASPETLKRQLLLEKIQTALTAPISNVDTVIPVELTTGLVGEGDSLLTYVRINDEIMRVNSFTTNSLNVTRAQLDTVASSHAVEDEVESFYRLQGKPTDLALKIMLSNNGNSFFDSLDLPRSINFISPTELLENALIFDYYSIKEKTGLEVGDFIQLDSGDNNDIYTIDELGSLDNGGSYIKTVEPLVTESEYTGSFKYKSKWNVLPFGLGMLTSEVDVAQFELINTQFGSNFVEYDFYIKDSIDQTKEFIDKEIFFPQGLYSIPRKARSSVKFIAPPFTSDVVPEINLDNILNINSIKQRRSVHKYLYNTYVFRYNVDSIEDKYLTGKIIVSSDSINRINVGKKQLKIESTGLRNNPDTTNMIDNVGQRLLDRYQYAPAYFDDIEVNYKTGYQLEVGDVVPFGGDALKFTNLQTGNRGTEVALFEVINKSLNVKNGKIKLNLVSTSFDTLARYAVVSVGSIIGAGSTTNRIRIIQNNDTNEYVWESDKWKPFFGQTITVRSADYSFEEDAIISGVDPTDKNFLLLDSPLSLAPLEGYVIEPAVYQGDQLFNDLFKVQFGHFVPVAEITSVTSSSVFDVSDGTKLKAGSYIVVNSEDFTRDSFGSKHIILSIVGNTVTLDSALSFLPLVGDLVNSSNFQDDGAPYKLI